MIVFFIPSSSQEVGYRDHYIIRSFYLYLRSDRGVAYALPDRKVIDGESFMSTSAQPISKRVL